MQEEQKSSFENYLYRQHSFFEFFCCILHQIPIQQWELILWNSIVFEGMLKTTAECWKMEEML